MKSTEKLILTGYYHTIAGFILPYIKDRPLSLLLKPKGPEGPGIYLKNMHGRKIEKSKIFIDKRRHPVPGKSRVIEYLVCSDEETLQYMTGLGCVDIHPWNSKISSPDFPDYIVIDLDPSDTDFRKVILSAKAVKVVLDEYGLTGCVKTSGKTGMHIFIPCSGILFPEARAIAEKICTDVHGRLPEITTTERLVARRGNAVYLDPNQNDHGDTVAAVYSVRPMENLTVSTPIEWEELTNKLNPGLFTMAAVKERLVKKGDLFSGIFDKRIIVANAGSIEEMGIAGFKKKTDFMGITTRETFTVKSEALLKKIKELIAEGNVTKITINDKAGKEIMSFPLTFGVAGAILSPVMAAIGALAALIGECSVTVERSE